MSGTENCEKTEQTGTAQQEGQTGAAESPAQKMDRILRSDRPQYLKKQVEKLRIEASKNRVAAKEALEAKAALEAQADEIRKELAQLRTAHRSEMIMRKFDAAGCLKSSLALKDVPEDCGDIDKFIENYRIENPFLFGKNKNFHGGLFKPQNKQILSPSQRMDKVIRSALGR